MSGKPLAYSYVRFSHPDQRKGDSLHRQTEATAAWCGRNGAALDESTTYRDLGKSAYTGAHRKNPDRDALALFERMVQDGKIPRGSYLIVENLDRLSREHIRPALTLLLNLIEAGVRVVQLKPVEQVFGEDVEPMQLLMAIMELSRGHNESALKSERVGRAWANKKEKARAGEDQPPRRKGGRVTKNMTAMLPAWVEERGGKLELIPKRATAVRHIFALAAAGHGMMSIARRLGEKRVASFTRSGKWLRSYIQAILADRRALGEHQPRKRDGSPDGEPMKGYYPAVVTEAEWDVCRAGALGRTPKKDGEGRIVGSRFAGRVGEHVNVFAGLLRNARDGDTYFCTRKHGVRVLINMAAADGRGTCYSLPFATFEGALFSALKEIDPHEILDGDSGPDETTALAAEVARLENDIAQIAADLDKHGESPTLYKRLRDKEARKAAAALELAEACNRAAHPLSETWGEAKTLLEAVEKAPDRHDARLRLRSAIRRIVESVYVLVVPRGRDRLCEVQVNFRADSGEAGRYRKVFIIHRSANGQRAGRWVYRTVKHPNTEGILAVLDRDDLRDPDERNCALGGLEAYPKDVIDALLKGEDTRPV
jgi:DNA invertase Pin-like site-specific DNA recombinase